MNISKYFLVTLVIFFLSACGESNTPQKESHSITSSQKEISFKNELLHDYQGENKKIIVEYSGEGIFLGYENEDKIAGWLKFEHKELSKGKSEITFVLDQENVMAEGVYSTDVIVKTGDIDESNVAQVKINVSLEIWKEQYEITPDVSLIEFKNKFLEESEVKEKIINVSYTGDDFEMGYSPDGNGGGWIDFEYEIIEQGHAQVKLLLKNENMIQDNFYDTKLRLITGDFEHHNREYVDIDVSLAVWRFEIDKESIDFDFIQGNENKGEFILSVIGNTANWEIVEIPGWLNADILSGEGNQDISFTVDSESFLDEGKTESLLTLKDNYSEEIFEIKANVGVKRPSLSVNKQKILISKINDSGVLNSEVLFTHDSNKDASWEIKTGTEWIEVEKTGESSFSVKYKEDLMIREGVYEGSVVLSLSTASQELEKEIPVLLVLKDDDVNSVTLNGNPNTLNASVVKNGNPYVYMAFGNEIIGFNLIDNEMFFRETLSDIKGTITKLINHPKENKLMLSTIDSSEEENIDRYYNFNLSSLELIELDSSEINYAPKDYIMINDQVFILTDVGEIATESLSLLHWDQSKAFQITDYRKSDDNNGYYVFDSKKNQIQLRVLSYNPYLSKKIKEDIKVVHSFKDLANYEVKGFDVSSDENKIAIANVNHELFEKENDDYNSKGSLHNGGYTKTEKVFWQDNTLNVLRYTNDYKYSLSTYDMNFNLLNEKILESRSISKLLSANGAERKIYINTNNNSIVIE